MIKQDHYNTNRHTERGLSAIKESLDRYGAGRPILIGDDDTLIAGSGTYDSWGDRPVRVIDITGDEYVVVIRDDLHPDDPKTIALAYADNRTSQIDRVYDKPAVVDAYEKLNLESYWKPEEIRDYKLEMNVKSYNEKEDMSNWQSINLKVPHEIKQRWKDRVGNRDGAAWHQKLKSFLDDFDD